VISRLQPRRSLPLADFRHVTKKPSPQALYNPRLTNCDACNSFRIRSYENCRVSMRSPDFSNVNSSTWPQVLTYPLFFHTLAHSFALPINSTLLFSSSSALFAKNDPGWGYLSPSSRFRMNAFLSPLAFRHDLSFHGSQVTGHDSIGCRSPLRMLRFGVP
jgi:hypothetical protein